MSDPLISGARTGLRDLKFDESVLRSITGLFIFGRYFVLNEFEDRVSVRGSAGWL